MKQFDLTKVETIQEHKRLIPGGYVCKITNVKDNANKEYLELEYDVAEGDCKGYYQELYQSKGFWGGKLYKSYSEKGLPFFKAFIDALTESNRGWIWNWNESIIRGCEIGFVLGEEEYNKNDGNVGKGLYVSKIVPTDKIRRREFDIPALKKLNNGNTSTLKDVVLTPANNDNLPF